jgi:hypothetical protein
MFREKIFILQAKLVLINKDIKKLKLLVKFGFLIIKMLDLNERL